MKQALTSRALISLSLSGTMTRGTYHKPLDRMAEGDLCASASGRTGVLIVNSLTAPRAGGADAAIYWAQVVAEHNYPCFRFDLPGLGDSTPEFAQETDLPNFIVRGGYASMIGQLLEELVERFELDGVIVIGHCAGAVTALYGGSKQKLCRGLVLMDPYFSYPRLVSRVAPAISIWSRHNRLGRLLRHSYDLGRDLQRAVRRDGLPPSANRALLEQWRHVASRGMPILIVQSPSLKATAGQFDYIGHAVALAGRKARVTVELVSGTDHSFANQAGRQRVREILQRWLATQKSLRVLARDSASAALASQPDIAAMI